jgi:CubicO group peptidase (beta-lactamase class C family)
MMNRRTAIKEIFSAGAVLALAPRIHALAGAGMGQNGHPNEEAHKAMAAIGQQFMQQYFAPALSVAIVRNSRFVWERPFGMAFPKGFEQTTSATLFRIGTASMPITSVAIFTLIEKGKMSLADKVFGPNGILGDAYKKKEYKQYVTDITVDHLLTHTCGGWPSDATDLMMHNNGWDAEKLISSTIEDSALTSPPGEKWVYSNFGYYLLGRIIEKVSGVSYQDYVKQTVLAPCGITAMHIAGNSLHDRDPNEAEYLGQFNEKPYSINVSRMDSAAGWIASPSDMARFLTHVGGTPTIPSLLRPETIMLMTTPVAAYPQSSPARYARGWMVAENGKGLWFHYGTLPGSTSVIVRRPDSMCWSAITSTRSLPADTMNSALDKMVWDMVSQMPQWNS